MYRVPDLELDLFGVNVDHARSEFYADGEVVHRLKALISELKKQA